MQEPKVTIKNFEQSGNLIAIVATFGLTKGKWGDFVMEG